MRGSGQSLYVCLSTSLSPQDIAPAVRSPLTLVLFSLMVASSAQQNNHWFLGHFASVDFTGGTATPTTGALETLEGTATISDQGGNLLFYTEGSTIWDRDNNVMPNGGGLLGGSSSTQAALIVPKPGACGIYYVFTTQDHMQNGDFRYSVVDMCLNNGYGDVIAGQKNIMISTPCSEKLTAVPNTNGTDYWIIAHELGGDAFLAYSLTPTGLDPVPVTSAVGSNHASNCMIGPLKASHDGTKLVCSKTFCTDTEMFDFDASTGVVSNEVDLATLYDLPNGVYGVEFSPNDQLLYISTTWAVNRLYQIDLIGQQALQIATGPGGGYYFGALQLAPDGRIYMARKDEAFLDLVEDPDVVGTGCGYLEQGLILAGGTTSDIGMPCMIPATILEAEPGTFTFDLGPDTSLCNGAIPLTPPNTCDDFFLWQDGSTANTFTITAPGTYWVQISNSCGIGADTIVVGNSGGLVTDLGPDTSLCDGGSVVLTAPTGADSVLWQDGSTQNELLVSVPGTYSVQVFVGGCTGIDTVAVTIAPLPVSAFSFSLDPCSGIASFTNTSTDADSYWWEFGDTGTSPESEPEHIYTDAGTYSVTLTATSSCGQHQSVQDVDIPEVGLLTMTGPDSLCGGATGTFVAALTGTEPNAITWSNGTADTMVVAYDPPASGWLSVSVLGNNGCQFSDSLFVTDLPLPEAAFTWASDACGITVQFTDQSSYATELSWDLGNGDQASGSSPSASYNTPGPFLVVLTATNACGGDTASQEVELEQEGQLTLSGPATLCNGATGQYEIDLSGTDAVSITWSTGLVDEPEIDLVVDGDTTLSVQVTGANGCLYIDGMEIQALSDPVAEFSWTQQPCDPTIMFTDASQDAEELSWDLGNGTTSTLTEPSATYPSPGEYIVELVALSNCGSDTVVVTVTLDEPGSLLLSGPSVICNEEPVTISASITTGPIASITWSTGDTAQVISLSVTDDLSLMAEAIGEDGCTYSAELALQVIGLDGEATAYVPNVFTPNGDGLNELFGPVLTDADGFVELLIFNRWGEEIYRTSSLLQPWNGRISGEPVPDGTYVYIVRWKDHCTGARKEEHGHVTLLC